LTYISLQLKIYTVASVSGGFDQAVSHSFIQFVIMQEEKRTDYLQKIGTQVTIIRKKIKRKSHSLYPTFNRKYLLLVILRGRR
jgi:hypothetical protein